MDNRGKKINTYVSRYVVPFYFEYENNGYERIRSYFDGMKNEGENPSVGKGEWIETGFWTKYKSDKDTQPEMDLYSYLPSIFKKPNPEEQAEASNLGTSFVFKPKGGTVLKDLVYRRKDLNSDIKFECTDLGFVLMRNGIGFIWYEAKTRSDISAEEYVKFQHDFKELIRTDKKNYFWKVIGQENKGEPFITGEVISKIISAEELGIRFWAERKMTVNGKTMLVPDKALLFQYLFAEQIENQELNTLAFRCANGYDEKYNTPKDIEDKIYRPFHNMGFYISESGMACVLSDEDTNSEFFSSDFPGKYRRDYFFIYILLLYQSFSSAHYSRVLTKLPADEQVYDRNSKYVERLESLNGQINLFLVKSVFESVSNVHHQNEVYRYGKNALCIAEDIQSLTIGLDALKDMEREKRDRKVDMALTIFGFMVAVSALLDGLNLIDWWPGWDSINVLHGIVFGGILFLTLYAILSLFKNKGK